MQSFYGLQILITRLMLNIISSAFIIGTYELIAMFVGGELHSFGAAF